MADCELADAEHRSLRKQWQPLIRNRTIRVYGGEPFPINREIEGYMVDMEAERAGDAYEAEYGADGYRMFPGNAPEADSEETAMPTLQEEKPKPKKVITTFHPEIPLDEKHDFRITDNDLGVGGAKEKYRRNITAIRLLHTLEDENRIATPEEQQILSSTPVGVGFRMPLMKIKTAGRRNTGSFPSFLPCRHAAARESTRCLYAARRHQGNLQST